MAVVAALWGCWAMQQALVNAGIDVLAVPINVMVAIVVLAIIIGVLASVLPARRAARLNILDAIAEEEPATVVSTSGRN